jgi:hypothetical protein
MKKKIGKDGIMILPAPKNGDFLSATMRDWNKNFDKLSKKDQEKVFTVQPDSFQKWKPASNELSKTQRAELIRLMKLLNEKLKNTPGLTKYEIWISGYSDWGVFTKHSFLGYSYGKNFKQACNDFRYPKDVKHPDNNSIIIHYKGQSLHNDSPQDWVHYYDNEEQAKKNTA